MWRYLRDLTFSRFDTIPECDRHTHTHTHTHTDRQTDRHTTTAHTELSIASRGKKATYLLNHCAYINAINNEYANYLIELVHQSTSDINKPNVQEMQ